MPAPLKCPTCGHEVMAYATSPLNKVQCPSCHSPLSTPTTDSDVVAMVRALADPASSSPAEIFICPTCNKEISEEAVRCPFCGEELEDEVDERPWERTGVPIRRDSEQHRGPIVLTLGIISLVCAPLTLCCGVFGVLLCAAGLGCGITAWVVGKRDLKKMHAYLMDPDGRGVTLGGKVCGIVGTILNSLGVLVALVIAGFYSYMFITMSRPPPVPPPPPPPVRTSTVVEAPAAADQSEPHKPEAPAKGP